MIIEKNTNQILPVHGGSERNLNVKAEIGTFWLLHDSSFCCFACGVVSPNCASVVFNSPIFGSFFEPEAFRPTICPFMYGYGSNCDLQAGVTKCSGTCIQIRSWYFLRSEFHLHCQFLNFSAGAMSNPFLRPPLSPWAPRLFAHVEYKDDAPVVKYTIKRDTYRISTAKPWYLTNRTMENHGKYVTFSTWTHLHLGFSMVNIRTWNQRMTKFAPSPHLW